MRIGKSIFLMNLILPKKLPIHAFLSDAKILGILMILALSVGTGFEIAATCTIGVIRE